MRKQTENFPGINPFNFSIAYSETDSASIANVHDNHIHKECEIYVNISGDVSFSVENSIYPITTGSVIITRPYEYHHCIYHSDKIHKHFWILFEPSGNESILHIFFDRLLGKNNHLVLPPEKAEELFSVCHRLTKEKKTDAEKYFLFFKLITILNDANAAEEQIATKNSIISDAINYINDKLPERFTIKEIAKKCNVSVNTLERMFLKSLSISPSEYIKKRRLANAAKLLSEGYNVTEASEESGFRNCSNFIAIFKKYYNVTPLKYKNEITPNK